MAKILEMNQSGKHVYMRLRLDNGRIEEIDADYTGDGWTYHTSADNNPALPKPEIRAAIIKAFCLLYADAEGIKIGNRVFTPRFCTVTISAIYNNKSEAYSAGYKEPTYYSKDGYTILGRSIDMYHMEFAAARE